MTQPSRPRAESEVLGRYVLHAELASGGMATVHLARLLGAAGFARTVAVKRLHRQFAKDPQFLAMFLDEARLAARVRHTNVVPIIDVVHAGSELFLVMEYVQGEALGRLWFALQEQRARIEPRIAVAIMVGVLHGLHAAHEARGDRGDPLGLVHRDVSPQNILVGVDGIARVVDFGIALAEGRLQQTREGEVKGKMAYLAPELVDGKRGDRRVDVWGASVVLWELLTQRKLFAGDSYAALTSQVITANIPAPSEVSDAPKSLDAIVMRGLSRDPAGRWSTARDMAIALEEALAPATPRAVGEWVETVAAPALAERARLAESIVDPPSSTEGDGPASVRTRLVAVGLGIAPRDADTSGEPAAPLARGLPITEPATERVAVRGLGGAAPPSRVEPPPVEQEEPSPPSSTATSTSESRRGARAWALGAALVLGSGLLASRLLHSPDRGRPASPPVPRASAQEAPSSTGSMSPLPTSSAPPPTLPASAAPPLPSGPAPRVAIASASPHQAASRSSAPKAAESQVIAVDAALPQAPSSSCDPPYRVVDGIRIPKKECL